MADSATGAEVSRATHGKVSRQTVSAILRRRQTHIYRDRLEVLCAALGLDVSEVLDDDGEGRPWTLPAHFDGVPMRDREELERLLAYLLRVRRGHS